MRLIKHGTARDALVDRLIEIKRAGKIRVVVPAGVRREVEHPRTPDAVRDEILPEIFTIPTGLTGQEEALRRRIATALQGNARPGKHAADAYHLAEAAKYGGYFITHDRRILDKLQELRADLPPSLHVVTIERFLEVYDGYEAGSLR
jgi:predicted nucleic acid-binding protein